MYKKMSAYYKKYFPDQRDHPRVFFAPSAVYLAGEYISVHNSPVISFAAGYGSYIAAAPRQDDKLVLVDFKYKKKFTAQLSGTAFKKSDSRGLFFKDFFFYTADIFTEEFEKRTGLDVFFYSDVPANSPFDRLHSFVAALAFAYNQIHRGALDDDRLTGLLEKVFQNLSEQDFESYLHIEKPLIYTMFAAKENSLLLYDMFQKRSRYMEIPDKKFNFFAVSVEKKSQKNVEDVLIRDQLCRKCVRKLQTRFPKIKYLTELRFNDLKSAEDILTPVERKRLDYVVSETYRVKEIVSEIRYKDIYSIGINMLNSQASLKNDFNATYYEIDALIEFSRTLKGVLGAKSVGVSGNISCLVYMDCAFYDTFCNEVKKYSSGNMKQNVSVFPVYPADGVHEVIPAA